MVESNVKAIAYSYTLHMRCVKRHRTPQVGMAGGHVALPYYKASDEEEGEGSKH